MDYEGFICGSGVVEDRVGDVDDADMFLLYVTFKVDSVSRGVSSSFI